jgi:hypothetical protein
LRNYIKTHWTGHTDFLWLLLLNLLGLRIAIYFAGKVIKNAAVPIWIIVFILIAIVLIWQVVGAIRAAKHSLDHPDGIFKTIALFFAATAITISTSWQVSDQYHHLFDPTPPRYVDPAIIDLPRSNDGSQVTFAGPITLKQYNAFRDIINVGKLRRINLNSTGGNIFAARGLHRLIVERGLDTHVSQSCFSACTIIFIAGTNRTAAQTAQFGFHAYAYHHSHTGQQIDVIAEQAKDIARFQRIKTPNSFTAQIFATPADEMWHPTHAELRDANVLN